MGLENFQSTYSGPDFKKFLLREKERFRDMSNIGFLAKRFADFGAEGLRETEKEVASKARAFHVNVSAPYPISQSDQYKLGDNYSSIVVGLSLQFMDKTLIHGAFDKGGFVEEHKKRVDGSVIYVPFQSNPWDVVAINNDQHQQMKELAIADKTLSIFFMEGFPLMPFFIQQHIGHGNNFDYIRKRVIPIYHSVASKLLTLS